MLESDDPNVDESEKFCGEINYQCNFTFTPPTASEPAVRQSEAAQDALPEGAIIALAVVGAGLLVAIVLFNVVRKVRYIIAKMCNNVKLLYLTHSYDYIPRL